MYVALLSAFIAISYSQAVRAMTVSSFAIGGRLFGFDFKIKDAPQVLPNQFQGAVPVADPRLFAKNSTATFAWDLTATANNNTKTNKNGARGSSKPRDPRTQSKFFFPDVTDLRRMQIRKPPTGGPGTGEHSIKASNRRVTAVAEAKFVFRGKEVVGTISKRDAKGRPIEFTYNNIVIDASVETDGDVVVPPGPGTRMEFGSFVALASITDPLHISRSDLHLSGADPDNFQYFQKFGLSQFSFGVNSEREYTVFAKGRDPAREIFSIKRNTSGLLDVHLDPNSLFYSLSSIEDVPDFTAVSPLDSDLVKSSILADLSDNMSLDSPLLFGVAIDGLSASGGIDGGVDIGFMSFLGEREMKIGYFDVATIPLPSSFFLCLTGLGLFGFLRRKHKLDAKH
jgi:hypothetical protein